MIFGNLLTTIENISPIKGKKIIGKKTRFAIELTEAITSTDINKKSSFAVKICFCEFMIAIAAVAKTIISLSNAKPKSTLVVQKNKTTTNKKFPVSSNILSALNAITGILLLSVITCF
jgi:hypothetical protein